MPKKYRKKPVVIEAIQWDGKNDREIMAFYGGGLCTRESFFEEEKFLEIPTLEGVLQASVGDYIIKGVQGEFYPCKPDIFEVTYEKVEDKNI